MLLQTSPYVNDVVHQWRFEEPVQLDRVIPDDVLQEVDNKLSHRKQIARQHSCHEIFLAGAAKGGVLDPAKAFI